jgi:tRNA-binding EMAP/Myf-like protein
MLTIAPMAPTVHLPSPEADRPSWLRVGLVAVLGFAIGVAWPKIAGVKLGPGAPAEALSAVAAASRAAEAASASAAVVAPAVAPLPSASASASQATVAITVSHGMILSCKNDDGESLKGKDCGGLAGLDPLVQTRLKRLAQAPLAADNQGKFNVVLGLDFKNNRISVESGKSSTVKDVESLKAFVGGEVKSMSLKPVDHLNQRYSVVYVVNIGAGPGEAQPSGSSSSGGGSHESLPDGTAAVVWESALVRDAPHTGNVVAHLPRGTKVQVGAVDSGFYKIKFGPSYANEGFVYRGAIGK